MCVYVFVSCERERERMWTLHTPCNQIEDLKKESAISTLSPLCVSLCVSLSMSLYVHVMHSTFIQAHKLTFKIMHPAPYHTIFIHHIIAHLSIHASIGYEEYSPRWMKLRPRRRAGGGGGAAVEEACRWRRMSWWRRCSGGGGAAVEEAEPVEEAWRCRRGDDGGG
jgi:hypothetical protein